MILCCGEALIDMIPTPTGAGAEGFVPHSGGAIFNTAIGLGRLGVPTGFLSGLSTDLFGQQLVSDLAASHVSADYAVRSDLPTTLAFVRLSGGQASYTFYDENTAGRMLEPEQLPHLSPDVTALYFGGISLISEPCAEFYAALALRDGAQRVIMLDPNIRPGFIRDEARYRARLDRMMVGADILKVSDEDLDWILPGSGTTEDKAMSITEKGVRIVIVTRGSAGASAHFTDGRAVSVPAQKAVVVDTVGAGDTFNSGVLAHLSRAGFLSKARIKDIGPADMEDALALGARVAAVTVARAGANPPWAQELNL
ncbi:carbohydrate kinase [Roseobacter denitrificans]|uniref:Fructokinase n=1 Tax=Roseobacter denitrificans (strain ATCC 33942 / OCh 114) TaxID=375451 RepID=Q165E0_ROSDO|nr:carbohydrate kinase [Roseobacter denitrificans]ABG32403.1 fructokinase [Roseobacter denitrificans OCh 114]AVL51873.1 carbohydrate kinase [Roseobacter denitrificans]SFF81347.1 fructokinase [Roseobacter denitrificans OCh 114]